MNLRRHIPGTLLAIAAFAIIACGTGTQSMVVDRDTSSDGAVPSEFAPAPIESVEIEMSDGVPVEYTALVTAVQPNSCAVFDHVQTRYDPHVPEVEISAVNEITGGADAACDQAISTFVQEVDLGVDFEPGSTYTVKTDDKEFTFTATGPSPIFSFDGFKNSLERITWATTEGDSLNQRFSPVPTRVLNVLNEAVWVYEFPTVNEAMDMALDVPNNEQLIWEPTPNYFRIANLFIIYPGHDGEVINALFDVSRRVWGDLDQQAVDRIEVGTVEVDPPGEVPTPVTGVLDDSADVPDELNLLTCDGVLGTPPPNFTLETRSFTDTAAADNPQLASMCLASYESAGGRGEALTVGLMTFLANGSANDHFSVITDDLVSGGFEPYFVGGDQDDQRHASLDINEGGIGSMAVMLDHRALVSIFSTPPSEGDPIWSADVMLEISALILERTPHDLRAN
ncbi:MAG: hypothetical protein HQ478_03385 [Chloroflexi bacterium]|nr:hypothetical protein [Chloroflexota bacterium]